MCYRYSFSFITIAAVLLLAVGIQGAPSDVVVEKAEDPAVHSPLPDGHFEVPEDCHQPKETGRCFALFYRYAYNVDTQACEEFVYGGCAGNKNNFESKEQCEQACLGKSASPTTEASTEANSEVTTENSTSA
ncbi:early lactation protein [Drosophila eugracilis]|uniref:early lactation protein n=1 Tax=Drosophila eugracilis TaxID=29029 RepID=UPI001BDB6C5C|nr:early lactation protein [Drosophila eugracilis]